MIRRLMNYLGRVDENSYWEAIEAHRKEAYQELKEEGYVAYSEWTGAITTEEYDRIRRSPGEDGITYFGDGLS